MCKSKLTTTANNNDKQTQPTDQLKATAKATRKENETEGSPLTYILILYHARSFN